MTTISVRTEEKVKSQASTLLADMGLDMSTAVNMFLRQVIVCKGIPFMVTLEEPDIETKEAMRDAIERKNLNGPFSSIEELKRSLNA